MNLTVIGPTHPYRGGISHYTSLLVRTLRTRHKVQFISYTRQYPAWLYPGNNDLDPSSELLVQEETDFRFDALSPQAWRELPQKVIGQLPRLILLPWSTVYWSVFYFLFLRALRGVSSTPVVFICHNVLEHEASIFKSRVSKSVLALGDWFVVHSRRDQANLLKWIGDSRADSIHVSPHPIYQHLQVRLPGKQSARLKLGVTADRVLLFFGFIREYKGLRYLLESLPAILQRFPVHLLIAGEAWEDPKIYLRLIQKLNLEKAVTFNPHYIPNEEVETFFAAADLVVVPYVSATQSGIVQLAFGFRKPVVVGAVGGIPEVVENGETGYLVPPRDPQAIAEAIIDFYNSGREQLFIANIERQLPRFSWQHMLETVEAIASKSCDAGLQLKGSAFRSHP
ncbi:MAG TPA: glycosyltransferase [Terriglobia bacterium]|nr:glycosyltransferase [Terriglobia bacterium]